MVNGGAWCGARTSHGHGGLGERERERERPSIFSVREIGGERKITVLRDLS